MLIHLTCSLKTQSTSVFTLGSQTNLLTPITLVSATSSSASKLSSTTIQAKSVSILYFKSSPLLPTSAYSHFSPSPLITALPLSHFSFLVLQQLLLETHVTLYGLIRRNLSQCQFPLQFHLSPYHPPSPASA